MRPSGPAQPQGPGVPPPPTALNIAYVHPAPSGAWWWLGCHGGSAVSTLEYAVPGGRDAHRAWPVVQGGGPVPVVLTARTHAIGLQAAQRAIQQWASGAVPGVTLLGLVLVADAPGRLPKALRDLRRLVSGGAPRTWDVPWVEEWRCGEPPTDHSPRQLTVLSRELQSLASPSGSRHV
ncbi:DUF6668 family protein [Streptomyces fildesensis]|uniref:DUF6668 family protein n=1 Tax=Streptomyces fildesensis TaxID=375757 RepID=UPI0018DF02FA|nr:DUF6668 family protein [Streptomyces fildesensis]